MYTFYKKDWRADIKRYNSLYEIDNTQILVFLRHQYLFMSSTLLRSNNLKDVLDAENFCEAAEFIQSILEITEDEDTLLYLDPADEESYNRIHGRQAS